MKKKVNFLSICLLLSVFLSLVFTSCEWANEEEQFGVVVCDTSQVTLSETIKPILQTNCYACHASSAASSFGAGINLESFPSLQSRANDASFLGSIKHSSGYSSMPKGAAKISSCDIRLIETWIANGAKND
jgi:uncharacterized membrane protein